MNDHDDLQPIRSKIIPGSLRRPLPFEEELRKAKQSPGYWWYRCLALSDAYVQCCLAEGGGALASTYKDFGDVRTPFPSWWLKIGRKLFAEEKARDVIRLDNAKVSDQHMESGDRILISIPKQMRKATAMRKIGKILAEEQAQHPVDIWAGSTARVKFQKSKIRKDTIPRLLRLIELRRRHPKMTLHELGKRAGIELDLYARTAEVVLLDEAEENRRLAIAVSRQLKLARHLVDNAAKGEFPKMKP